jgi:predicted component of type VI protein secretion system
MQALEAMFMADVNFVADHPNIPRMLLGSLGRSKNSALSTMIEALIQRYEQRLSSVVEEAQQSDELRATIDKESAARLYVAAIQHFVFRTLVRDELREIREAAPAAFASYRACVEATR